MGDFRVGFLLQTPPRLQYAAQLIGTLVASLVAPAMFVLFTTAYPCILDISGGDKPGNGTAAAVQAASCEFPGPSIAAWRAVAVAATGPSLPVPRSSQAFSILMAGLGCASVLVRHLVWRGKWEFVRAYHPNMMILAMAFTLPSPQYGIAIMMGAVAAAVWRRKESRGWDRFGFAVAAGLVAGEGIGGTLNGVLAVAGLGGGQVGTSIGCPAGRC